MSASTASATNFYAGANVGAIQQEGTFKVIDDALNPSVGIDRPKDYALPDGSDLTYSLYAGYKLASDLFFEFGFAKNQEIEGDIRQQPSFAGEPDRAAIEDYETDYMYAAFVGVWPVQNNWAFNARLGFSVWDISYKQYSADIPAAGLAGMGDIKEEPTTQVNRLVSQLSDSTSALLVGFGVSYAINKNIELKLLVESHIGDFAFTNLDLEYDATSVTLGGAYHF